MENLRVVSDITGFDWDQGNRDKNWKKHRVNSSECEQVIFNQPLIVLDDTKHSKGEKRYYALGKNDSGRRLFMVFTIRKGLIRVISARDICRKERLIYEKN